MTVNEIYQSGLKLLENNNIENSKFEAQSLLQKAFSLDRVGFIIHKTDKADENCSHNFLKFIEKRIVIFTVYSRQMELYGIRF